MSRTVKVRRVVYFVSANMAEAGISVIPYFLRCGVAYGVWVS